MQLASGAGIVLRKPRTAQDAAHNASCLFPNFCERRGKNPIGIRQRIIKNIQPSVLKSSPDLTCDPVLKNFCSSTFLCT